MLNISKITIFFNYFITIIPIAEKKETIDVVNINNYLTIYDFLTPLFLIN